MDSIDKARAEMNRQAEQRRQQQQEERERQRQADILRGRKW